MGLYERLLKERIKDEQHRGGSLPGMRGLDSKVLVRRIEDALQDQAQYAADLSVMHRLITRDPHTAGEGERLGSLKVDEQQGVHRS